MATDSEHDESESSSIILNISSIFGPGKAPPAPTDNLADYDLSNFLNILSIKLPEDDLRAQYQKALDNLSEWQAWEAGTVENGVASRVKSRELPSDTSLTAVLKRHGYRRLILQACREKGPW